MLNAKCFTLVSIDDAGALSHEMFHDLDDLREQLRTMKDPESCFLFRSEPVTFTVDRAPTITIGRPRGRRPAQAVKPVKRGRRGRAVAGEIDRPGSNGTYSETD